MALARVHHYKREGNRLHIFTKIAGKIYHTVTIRGQFFRMEGAPTLIKKLDQKCPFRQVIAFLEEHGCEFDTNEEIDEKTWDNYLLCPK